MQNSWKNTGQHMKGPTNMTNSYPHLPAQSTMITNWKKLNLCEFATPHAANLNKHMIKKTGLRERPFKCNQCDHASHHANNLKKHMKVHSEERPYKCN